MLLQIRLRQKQAGQGIVGVIVGLAVTFAVGLAATQFIIQQNRFLKSSSQKLELLELRGLMLQVLRNPSSCSCQLNPNVNTSIASRLVINTLSPTANINLGVIRSTCDFSSSQNIIARENQRLPNSTNQIRVTAIQLGKIASTGVPGSYRGELLVSVAGLLGETTSSEISMPLYFSIDTKDGTATARPISSCSGDTVGAGIDRCPSGWTMIGPPRIAGTYCMETRTRSARDLPNAADDCASTQPLGRNNAQLCTREQLILACGLAGFAGMPGGELMNINRASVSDTHVINQGVCGFIGTVPGSGAPYRCCVQ